MGNQKISSRGRTRFCSAASAVGWEGGRKALEAAMRRLPVLFTPHRNADNETSSSTSASDQSRHPFEVSKSFFSSNTS